jgi:ribosomal protein L37AE/L43A
MEYVFAGALALIIIGALALSLNAVMGGGGPRGDVEDAHWKCEACEEVFVDNDYLPEEEMIEGPGVAELDCKACGAEDSVFLMIKCPNCEQWYIPESHRQWEAVEEGAEIRDICPHCGTDYVQYWLDKRRNKN